MPEECCATVTNRTTTYPSEKSRSPGNGEIEEFRAFILRLLKARNELFYFFHDTIATNKKQDIREALLHTKNPELIRWLERYLVTT